MTSEHTAGPWLTDNNDGYSINRIFADSRGHHAIAEVIGDSAETEANARLISAAPDLLEVLEKALADACGAIRVDGMMLDWLDAARAAIAKARGADFAPRSDDVGQNDA